jgi:hypothetical protein
MQCFRAEFTIPLSLKPVHEGEAAQPTLQLLAAAARKLLCHGAAALTFPLHPEPLPKLVAAAATLNVLDAASG